MRELMPTTPKSISGNFELVHDPIDERIEELAAITEAWQKNRDRKRPSPMLRKAIIFAARDLWDEVVILEEQAGE